MNHKVIFFSRDTKNYPKTTCDLFFLDFQIRHFQLFFNVLTQQKELWDAPEKQINEMNVMERIFGDDIFESRIIEEIFPVNVPENILTALNPATHDE